MQIGIDFVLYACFVSFAWRGTNFEQLFSNTNKAYIAVICICDLGSTIVFAATGRIFKSPEKGKPFNEDVPLLCLVNMLNNIWIYICFFYYGNIKKGLEVKKVDRAVSVTSKELKDPASED